MAEAHPTSLTELEERIESGRTALFLYVDGLTSQERDELRDQAGWSAKDHVAHLIYWERSMVYLLSGRPRHEGLGVALETYLAHDFDEINAEIYRQHRDRDWPDVRAEFDEVHKQLTATLRDVGWDGLQQPYAHFAPDEPGDGPGAPAFAYVAGNTFFHYDEHLGWIVALTDRDNGEGASS